MRNCGCLVAVHWMSMGRLLEDPNLHGRRPLDVHWRFLFYMGCYNILYDILYPFISKCYFNVSRLLGYNYEIGEYHKASACFENLRIVHTR